MTFSAGGEARGGEAFSAVVEPGSVCPVFCFAGAAADERGGGAGESASAGGGAVDVATPATAGLCPAPFCLCFFFLPEPVCGDCAAVPLGLRPTPLSDGGGCSEADCTAEEGGAGSACSVSTDTGRKEEGPADDGSLLRCPACSSGTVNGGCDAALGFDDDPATAGWGEEEKKFTSGGTTVPELLAAAAGVGSADATAFSADSCPCTSCALCKRWTLSRLCLEGEGLSSVPADCASKMARLAATAESGCCGVEGVALRSSWGAERMVEWMSAFCCSALSVWWLLSGSGVVGRKGGEGGTTRGGVVRVEEAGGKEEREEAADVAAEMAVEVEGSDGGRCGGERLDLGIAGCGEGRKLGMRGGVAR